MDRARIAVDVDPINSVIADTVNIAEPMPPMPRRISSCG